MTVEKHYQSTVPRRAFEVDDGQCRTLYSTGTDTVGSFFLELGSPVCLVLCEKRYTTTTTTRPHGGGIVSVQKYRS